jgi:hypothetical protein
MGLPVMEPHLEIVPAVVLEVKVQVVAAQAQAMVALPRQRRLLAKEWSWRYNSALWL